MSFPDSNNNIQPTFVTKAPKLNSFRRIQIAFAGWGILLIIGGWLHNTYASNQAWGLPTLLVIWIALSVLGLLAMYLLQPTVLFSGLLFVWAGLILGGLFLTWLIVYPLNGFAREFVSALWHAFFAIGYFVTGYYMDRRLLFLAGWEALVGLAMLVGIGLDFLPDSSIIYQNLGLTLGLSSGIPLLLAALPIWKQR